MKQIQCRYVFLSHCSCVKKMKKTLFFPSLKSRFFADMTKQLTRSFWRNQTQEFWGVAKPKTLIELGQLVGSGEHQGVVVRGEPLLYTPSTKILKLTCKLMNISTTSWNAYGTLDWWDLMGYFPLEQFGTGDSCPSTSFQMVGMLSFQGCLPTSPVFDQRVCRSDLRPVVTNKMLDGNSFMTVLANANKLVPTLP